ncbi:LysE family translocator [Microbulbifer variabilis]|uniref:LysE family translocator n=1 Tax=Microbulbifer variabilis TaxID=266805 RepID=UPI001CFE014A|nr:LysE family translocator [Microbulbifer variabilis]
MPEFPILVTFLGASVLLAISPGPDLLLISTYSATRGLIAGFLLSMGVFLAGLTQTLLVAFGLGHIMQTIPFIALAVKILGALYLAWLGINLIRQWRSNLGNPQRQVAIEPLSAPQLITRGLINNLMNPKALVFFSLFLPQFTSSAQPFTQQILLLGFLLSTIALTVNTVISFSFSRLKQTLSNQSTFHRHFDGFLGVVFLGLAGRLASE